MTRLVLDTNVLVSANLAADGWEALAVSLALGQQVVWYVSEPILEEYERVLRYPRFKFVAGDIDRFLARVLQACIIVAPARVLQVCPDEPDNRFLECAEEADAEFLITGNQRHFPGRWKNTRVVKAREFLEILTSAS